MDFQIVSQSVTTQVLVMLILIIIGYVISKKDILTQKGASEMSTVLINIVTPCVIIKAYHIKFMKSEITNLFIAYCVSIAVHIIYILLARVYFWKTQDKHKKMINRLSGAFSNCGFMGIPLIEACFGTAGVFFGSAYLCIFHVFIWTYCKRVFEKSEGHKSRVNLLNPGIIGVTLGLFFYFTQIKLPVFAYNSISFLADLNTPLAMIVLGNFLARSGIIKSLKDPGVYTVSLFKLLIAPLLLAFCLSFINADPVMAISIVISAACPVAAIIPIFANRHHSDYDYATNLTVATTVISLVTIPVVSIISSFIL